MMFKSWLTIAWRSLLKNRLFTILHLTGLSTALAAALLICLWIYDEFSVDAFHGKKDRLYQVMENKPNISGVQTTDETPALLAETISGIMPQVEHAVVTTPPSWFPRVAVSAGDKAIKRAGLFAGGDYFTVFSYPLTQGNKDQVLSEKGSMVISEKLAIELFGSPDKAMGKTISWQIDRFKKQGIVTGIFKGVPANASIQFDFILPFAVFKDLLKTGTEMETEMAPYGPFITYLVLKRETDIQQFNSTLSAFLTDRSGAKRNLFVTLYADNYLYAKYENGVQAGGRIAYVRLFALIAVFIIIIACINFVNLSTAKASGRMKEMGIRKTIGANRRLLVFQYLSESMLITFLSLVIALLIVILVLPVFNEITGKQLALNGNAKLAFSVLGITVLTGLLSGVYPALYLSGFSAVKVLKGNFSGSVMELWSRKGLVIFQFAVSVIFIVAVLAVYRQMSYIQSRQTGYDKENVIYFDSEGNTPDRIDAFLSEIKKIPGVANASSMVGNIQGTPSVSIPWKGNGHNDTILFRPLQVNYDLIETLDIQMAGGRSFSRDFGADSANIILNEAAVKAMGIQDPVGKMIDFGGGMVKVVGIIKNFHFQSLHETIKPLFLQLDKGGTIMVKIKPGMEMQAIDQLKRYYKTYNPGFSLDYKFLDEDYQAQYIAEKQVMTLAKYFTGLTVLISCLGLFGLVAHTAEKKRKEIGIRKILGATLKNIALLLSKDFLVAVLAAIAIGLPIAWWIIKEWLNGFAYRIPVSADLFLIPAMVMILLSLFTISAQIIKAAFENPAKSIQTV